MALSQSYGVLLTGRILVGLGVGSSLMIAPLYAAELAPYRLRGALVTMIEVSINVGILLGYVIGFSLSGMSDEAGWRWMLGLGYGACFSTENYTRGCHWFPRLLA